MIRVVAVWLYVERVCNLGQQVGLLKYWLEINIKEQVDLTPNLC